MDLLTFRNHKLDKSTEHGYVTASLALSSKDPRVCPWATEFCKRVCVMQTAGRNVTRPVRRAQAWRTELFFSARDSTVERLINELDRFNRRVRAKGLLPACRLNAGSDIPWERVAPEIFERFPSMQFYDYTKATSRQRPSRFLPKNYYLTYSHRDVEDKGRWRWELDKGRNVAVMSRQVTKAMERFPLIDGDHHDLRFLDQPGSIIVLKEKGAAKGGE